jgi:hypothetical protein
MFAHAWLEHSDRPISAISGDPVALFVRIGLG